MATKKSHIKLLFFSPYFHPYVSGLTQYPYHLFSDGNLPVDTTCLTFAHTEKLDKCEQLNKLTTIIRMPYALRISKGFISPQSLSFFWRETKKNDIVMINLPSVEGAVLALFALLQSKPLITLLHCEVLLPFSPMNLIINMILNCCVFFQLLLSKKIIIYTKDYYKDKSLYQLFKNKMEVLLPPIHTSPIDAAYLDELYKLKNKYKYVIGFCGRLAAEKGIEILIESASAIKDSIIFLAGPTGKEVVGENLYYKKIYNILETKKIPYLFLGTLSDGKLSSFYKSLDVLVLPSLNKTEAFGMVQVEAMLQGTPVVASNLPGVRIPIQMTKMGLLAAPANLSNVTQAILSILTNRHAFSNDYLVSQVKKMFDSKKTYDSIYSVIKSSL